MIDHFYYNSKNVNEKKKKREKKLVKYEYHL